MKLTEGVHLHVIKSRQFTTQRIKIRFSAPMERSSLAGRVLVASMMETANKAYPTAQLLRRKLASLYGADFSTTVSKKGAVHLVDLDINFLASAFLAGQDLTDDIMTFLKTSLLHPLTKADSFDEQFFELEQKNLISYLETETEDNFYQADQALSQLFYQTEPLNLPYLGTPDLIRAETPQACFRTFQKMLTKDRIDIFCLGHFDEQKLLEYFESFMLAPRQVDLQFEQQQMFSKITREQIEKKAVNQSILELGYHLPISYTSPDYCSLLVLDSLFGNSPQSKLFVNIREAEGLAYTIGSQIDSFTGCLKVYAGIDKNQRHSVMKLIHRQWLELKKGQFTLAELEEAKRLIKANLLLAQDRPVNLLEEAYHQQIFGQQSRDLDNMLTEIDKVNKEAIINVAGKIKLQALYFMEGTR